MFSHGNNGNKVVIFRKAGTISEAARHLDLIWVLSVVSHSKNSNKVVIFPKAGTLLEAARVRNLYLQAGELDISLIESYPVFSILKI